MTTHSNLPRRTFLKGLGTLMALPLFESVAPFSLAAAPATSLAAVAGAPPRRMAYIYVPNGANMPDWTPQKEGAGFELPSSLEPLAEHRPDFSVLSGLTQDAGRAKMDGAGDHARASATWLTSTRIRKTNGVDIHAGVSADIYNGCFQLGANVINYGHVEYSKWLQAKNSK